jgi:hypothetical protein
MGVDLNRNWKVTGYGIGASSSPCSDTYKVKLAASKGSKVLVIDTLWGLMFKIGILIFETHRSSVSIELWIY